MNDPQKLLEEIEGFLIRMDMNPTEFGRLAKNDGALVFRLRDGKDVRSGTASDLRRFMETYRRPLGASSRKRSASAAHA